MKILSAEFCKSAFEQAHWTTDNFPEIAFLGRSNVGKSSLINSLLARKGLARTSNTPGRTQSINFFLINESFYFVDLPGYGYARVSKKMRGDWGKMAEEYLAEREQLRLCIQLIDMRHSPTELDRQLNEWLLFHGKRHIVAATKSDKLNRKEFNENLREIKKVFQHSEILPYSAMKGIGKDELWTKILKVLSESN